MSMTNKIYQENHSYPGYDYLRSEGIGLSGRLDIADWGYPKTIITAKICLGVVDFMSSPTEPAKLLTQEASVGIRHIYEAKQSYSWGGFGFRSGGAVVDVVIKVFLSR